MVFCLILTWKVISGCSNKTYSTLHHITQQAVWIAAVVMSPKIPVSRYTVWLTVICKVDLVRYNACILHFAGGPWHTHMSLRHVYFICTCICTCASIYTDALLGCMTVRTSPDLQTHTHITLSQLFLALIWNENMPWAALGELKLKTWREREREGE